MAQAAVGLAADRHAMAAVKAVVQNRDVFGGAVLAGLDGDVVIAGADRAVGDGDVARRDGIDAIGVARSGRRVDAHAPRSKAVDLVERDVEVGRVAQRDAIQREVAAAVNLDQARHVLARVLLLRAACHLPPRFAGAVDHVAALAVNDAVAVDAAAAGLVGRDEGTAAVACRIDRAATRIATAVQGRIGAGVERYAAVDQQGYAAAQHQRAGVIVGALRAGRQAHGVAGGTVVDGRLYARCFVNDGYRPDGGQHRARRRRRWFADAARILRTGAAANHKARQHPQAQSQTRLHCAASGLNSPALSGTAMASSRATMREKKAAPFAPRCVRSKADLAAPATSTAAADEGDAAADAGAVADAAPLAEAAGTDVAAVPYPAGRGAIASVSASSCPIICTAVKLSAFKSSSGACSCAAVLRTTSAHGCRLFSSALSLKVRRVSGVTSTATPPAACTSCT